MSRVVINADAAKLPIADESVAAIVTSPPYNVGIVNKDGLAEYHDDSKTWDDYSKMVASVAAEMERVLIPGGRAWVNIQPTVPMILGGDGRDRFNLLYLWEHNLLKHLLYRDTIVWVQDSHDGGCAWGSWGMPSAPNLRGGHEVVLLFYKRSESKDGWRRECPPAWKGWRDTNETLGGELTDLYRNVWKIRPARSDYKATFPVELAARCLRLSTWPDETILDPFVGTGTTLDAAETLAANVNVNRLSIGVEMSNSMALIAKENK